MLPKKYVADVQLNNLLEKSAKFGHRALLFLYTNDDQTESECSEAVGEKIMVIHYLMSRATSGCQRPSILWCYAENSIIPRVKRKVLKRLEERIETGHCDMAAENPFHLFLISTKVKFLPFTETSSILGHTYNLCIIQDIECLTPNVLCRVSETVCGGGVIIFVLSKLRNLRDWFKLPMTVHRRLKTHLHPHITPLFNERFVVLLSTCKAFLILDKEMKVRCELAKQKACIKTQSDELVNDEETALRNLMESISDAEKPLPQLCKLCCTLDQAKALLKMIDILTEKNGHSTVSLTAARGRGKSTALGLAVAAAIYFGVNNIFVVAPSPENLNTFFEFLCKGFDALDYEEDLHYDIIQSTNPEFNKAVVRVNVYARHRQNIQYVSPHDCKKVSQAELVVIDEAAAIPLVYVKSLLGFHNVLMASTVSGYEGTGRSLSLKLLQRLRQQAVPTGATAVASASQLDDIHLNCRPLFELTLEKSIRYSPNDPVEEWLNDLLCLDAASVVSPAAKCPPPKSCNLYYVNRKVLFSGHKETESFLHQLVSFLVASHYRNSPDDLQILSDAPAHHLFVLLPPLPESGSVKVPLVYCVLQVCEEGGIPVDILKDTLNEGRRPSGDIIPWTIAAHFFNPNLAKLKGIRIIRIATHPDYQNMGYGSAAVNLLLEYYKKRFVPFDMDEAEVEIEGVEEDSDELIAARKMLQPLLTKLNERPPEEVDYVGVSFGLCSPLFGFWKKCCFTPIYISLVANKITAEYNCMMLNPLLSSQEDDLLPGWAKELSEEFHHRFTSFLGAQFSSFHPKLAVSILTSLPKLNEEIEIDWTSLECLVGGHDLQRLESYAKNLSDRHLITDLLPALAHFYFRRRLPSVHLSHLQEALLVGCGFQFQPIESVAKLIDLPIESALGQFNRGIRRILNVITEIQERTVAEHLPESVKKGLEVFKPVTISLQQELEETAQEFESENVKLVKKSKLSFGKLDQYVIKGSEKDWLEAMHKSESDTVTIASFKRATRMTEAELERELAEPKDKKGKRKGKASFQKKNKQR